MLHSDDIDQKFADHRFLKMFVRKNRDGRLGKVNYTYFGDYVKFVETEWSNEYNKYVTVEQEDLSLLNNTKEEKEEHFINNIEITDDDLPF